MVLYKKLNLCSTPLNGDCIADLMDKKEDFIKEVARAPIGIYTHLHANDEIERYISPVLLRQLNFINVKPAILINFSEYGQTHETWLHRDLTFIKTDWYPLEFGINWELAQGTTTFNWYKENHNNCKTSSWPLHPELLGKWPRTFISGVRYFDESELTPIGSVTFDMNTAYLVRTDIPHKIVSSSPGNLRICISIRFFVEDIPTFDKALEVFEPYYA